MRTHKRIWLSSRGSAPSWLWIVVEFVRWVIWIAIRGPQLVLRMRNLSQRPDYPTVRGLVLSWALPPYEIFRFNLNCDPEKALDYVYDVEAGGFHRWMNAGLGRVTQHTQLLNDKVAASAAFRRANIPTAEILSTVLADSQNRLLETAEIDQSGIFCKQRAGHGAQNAFAVWDTPDGQKGLTHDGRKLRSEAEIEECWSALLAKGEAIIQPLLENHGCFGALDRGRLITSRYISQRTQDGYQGYFAMIEYPGPPLGDQSSSNKAFVPINPVDGTFLDIPLSAPHAAVLNEKSLDARARWPDISMCPQWGEIQQLSHKAHQLVPELWAVAWDWAITPEGPVLLEGNSGWSLSAPQILMDQPMARLAQENHQN